MKILRSLKWKALARSVYYRVRGLLMAGKKRHCPLCGGSFHRFLSKGDPVRAEAMCPRCLSLERHRLLGLFLRRDLSLGKNPVSLVHFAPEPGIREHLKALPTLHYVTCDLVPGRGDVAADLARLGFRSETFDMVLCCHVLEHVQDDNTALHELWRILKPGGLAILQVPLSGDITDEDSSITDLEERRRRFGQEDHVRLYGKDFKNRLQNAGFQVEVVEYSKQLDVVEIERSRLMANDDAEDWIFLAHKENS